jgi:phosphoribosylformylglycinamidine cyclo-ligase
VLGHYHVKNVVHGIAHITGGGLLENLERILPESTEAVVQRNSWAMPPIFNWIQRLGEIESAEMERVFNMGIGLVLVVSAYFAESIRQQLSECELESWPIGFVREGPRRVVWGS